MERATSDITTLLIEPTSTSDRTREPRIQLRTRLILADALGLAVVWIPLFLRALILQFGAPKTVLFGFGAVALGLAVLSYNELYLSRVASVRALEITRLIRATALFTLLLIVEFRLFHLTSRIRFLLLGGVLSLISLLIVRGCFRAWLAAQRASGRLTRSITVLGADAEACELIRMIEDHPESGFRVNGVIGNPTDARMNKLERLYLGPDERTHEILSRNGTDGVILVVGTLPAERVHELVVEMQRAGMHIQLSNGLHGVDYRRLRPSPIAYQSVYYLESPEFSQPQLVVKRLVDVVCSLLGLLILSPLMLAIAAGIKFSDRGPVFFKQERVGLAGSRFGVLKFRTMVVDAEKKLADLQRNNERVGPLFKMTSDPRVTKLGHILRPTSLDELPQLINVLRGEMSLIGPRPALPKEVEAFDDRLLERLRMRPGITGLWQVEARDNPHFGAYRRLDLFYVDNWTLGLDFVILVATIEQVLAKGIRSIRDMITGGHRSELHSTASPSTAAPVSAMVAGTTLPDPLVPPLPRPAASAESAVGDALLGVGHETQRPVDAGLQLPS